MSRLGGSTKAQLFQAQLSLAGLGRRLAAGVGALGLLAAMPAAVQAQSQTKPQLDGAVQRAARSGQLVLSGFADVPPLMMLSPKASPPATASWWLNALPLSSARPWAVL